MHKSKLLMVMPLLAVLGACSTMPKQSTPVAGGYTTIAPTDTYVVKAAQFAVEAQATNSKQQIQLIEVLDAQQQVVAGVNYQLLLSANIDSQVKRIKAVVWWQAWSPTPYQLQSWTVVE